MFWIILLVIFGLLLLYILFWPVSPKPVGVFKPPKAPALSGIYENNNHLQAVERLGDGHCPNPESVTSDAEGLIYTGVEDGRIIRLDPEGGEPELFVNTGGRPLGMMFDAVGNLIVADSKLGLLSIEPDRTIKILTNEASGRPISYANDLDIAADGTIYFSDFQFYREGDVLADFVDGRPLTRLLAYDPHSQTTRVVLDGLYAANGVAIGPDDSYVLVNEFFAYRVTRYWLKGPQQGQTDMFIENLPGLPDNITFNGRDTFWLALYGPRSSLYESLQANPFLRGVMKRLPAFLIPTDPTPFGCVLGLHLEGEVIHFLLDPTGEFASQVTSAFEYAGKLYLGNIGDSAIKRLPVP